MPHAPGLTQRCSVTYPCGAQVKRTGGFGGEAEATPQQIHSCGLLGNQESCIPTQTRPICLKPSHTQPSTQYTCSTTPYPLLNDSDSLKRRQMGREFPAPGAPDVLFLIACHKHSCARACVCMCVRVCAPCEYQSVPHRTTMPSKRYVAPAQEFYSTLRGADEHQTTEGPIGWVTDSNIGAEGEKTRATTLVSGPPWHRAPNAHTRARTYQPLAVQVRQRLKDLVGNVHDVRLSQIAPLQDGVEQVQSLRQRRTSQSHGLTELSQKAGSPLRLWGGGST